MANQIKFNIGFNVDKAGLNDLKASLAQLQNLTPKDIVGANSVTKAKQSLKEIQDSATLVEKALAASFNPTFNTYNIDKFKTELRNAGTSISDLTSKWSQAGSAGQIAINGMARAFTKIQIPVKQTNELLDKMGKTFANTIRWSIASSAINGLTGSVQKAWSFTKELDASLNDIMIVTGKGSDEMAKFARQANKAAKELKTSTNQYTQAALIYYQQGLSDDQVAARSDVTVKAANVTGQSAQTVSEQLTAIWNGYKVSAQEAEIYIDKVAAVAASTAADLEELSVGMSRVASAANIMGVDIDQLNAQLATIVSVTREAPESVGTALKTVYARMSDIRAGLDSETTLDEYTKQMAQMGINVLDAKGNLRDMGTVVEEIGNKWGTLNRNQQVSLAQSIAGTRQYSRMMALFDNWDMYNSALQTSQTSMGTLQKQQDTYAESLEAHLKNVKTSIEDIYISLVNTDSFKTLLSFTSKFLNFIDSIVEGMGGAGTILAMAVPLMLRLTSSQISSGLTNLITNFRNSKIEVASFNSALETMNEMLASNDISDATKKVLKLQQSFVLLRQEGKMSAEEYEKASATLESMLKNVDKIEQAQQKARSATSGYEQAVATFARPGQTMHKVDAAAAMQTGAAAAASGQTIEQIQQNDSNYRNYIANIDALEQNMLDAAASAGKFEKAIQEYNKALESGKEAEITSKLEALQRAYAEVEKAATQFKGESGDYTFLTSGQKSSVTKRLSTAKGAIDDLAAGKDQAENVQKLNEAVQSLKGNMAQAKSHIKDVTTEMRSGSQASKEAAEATNAYEKQLATLNETTKKLKLQDTINSITKITSGFLSLAAAISSIKNIGSIWKQEDLSTGEKIWQTLIGISTAVMSIIPALQSFNALKELIQKQLAKDTIEQVTGEKAKQEATAKTTQKVEEGKQALDDYASSSENAQNENVDFTNTLKEQNAALDENTRKIRENQEAKRQQQQQSDNNIDIDTDDLDLDGLESNNKIKLNKSKNRNRNSFATKKIKASGAKLTNLPTNNASSVVTNTTKNVSNITKNASNISSVKNVANASKSLNSTSNVAKVALNSADDVANAATKAAGAAGKAASATGQAAGAAGKAAGALGKIGGWLKGLGPIISKISFVFSIITAVVEIGKIINKTINEEKVALEEANKKVEEATTKYANALQKYEDTLNSLSEYNNAASAIDEMVIGTDEWRDSVQKLNEEVLDLMDKYEGLSQYVTTENGQMVISEEGQEYLEQKARDEKNAAYAEKANAQLNQIAAEEDMAAKKMANESKLIGHGTDWDSAVSSPQDYVTSAGSLALTGLGIGMMFGPIGAAIGAGIGLIGGLIVQAATDFGDSIEEGEKNAWMSAAEILAETDPSAFDSKVAFDEALKGSGLEHLADQMWEERDALRELTETVRENNIQQQLLREQIASSWLADTSAYKNAQDELQKAKEEEAKIVANKSDYSSAQDYYADLIENSQKKNEAQSDIDLLTSIYSSESIQAKKKEATRAEIQKQIDEGDSSDNGARAALIKEYWANKLGIPQSDIKVKWADGGIYTVEYLKKDGTQETLKWQKYNELVDNLTEQRLANFKVSETEAQEYLNRFKALSEEQQKAFKSFVGDGKGDFADLTKEELNKLTNALSFDGLNWEQVKADESKLADLKKYAEALGLETTDEALKTLLQGINTAVNNYNLQEAKISDNFLGRDISTVFNGDAGAEQAFNNLSLSARTSLSKFYNDLALSTKDGANVASRILSTLTEENADTFMYAFNAVDWTNQESIASYTGLLKEFDSTLTDAELEEYTFQMRYLNGVIEDFNLDAAAAKFSNLQEIINNLKEAGDTISGEQYKSLSSEMQKYFLRMADGTYALIGSAETFREAAEAARKAELEYALAEAQKKSKADFENATTLTQAEKDAIKLQKEKEAAEIRKSVSTDYSRGSFTSYADLGDGFFGEVGEWFATTFTGKGLSGGVPIEDIATANAALNLIRRWEAADKATIDSWQSQITGGNMWENDFEAFLAAIDTAKAKANEEATRLTDANGGIAEAEKEALEKKLQEAQAAGLNTDNVTISDSEIDTMTQILAEAGSTSAVEEYLAKWKEYYQGLGLSTEKIEELGNTYLDFYENAAESFKIEVDPYEELDRSLSQVEKRLAKIEETQNLLYGQAAIDNLKAYNEELANQVDLINQKIELNQEETQKAKENLEALTYINPDGSKIKFSDMSGVPDLEYDDEGNITNWADYVGAIESYIKENYDADSAKSAVEALNSGRDEYIAELEKGAELIEQKRQTFLTALEKNLEAFELEIQIKIDENEFKQSILDFKTEMGRVIGDTASFDLVKDDIATYMQALNDLDQMTKVESLDGLTEADIAAGNLISKADYEAKKREIINSLMEEGISLREAVIAMDEQANEKYENYINLIDSANSALEHQKNLYELIYGDQAFTKMNSYYLQQVANAESIAAARLAQYQQDQEFMANAGTELSEDAQEKYLESAENYFQALNDLAALYQEKYINELKTALDNFDKEISGGLGTQALRDEWDWVAAVAEDSLSKIDAAIGISSLESSFTKAIDAAPSISAQKTLNKLRDEELAKLRAKEKLTQADLDRAQKSLEIAQAEIALQEAQMNKSKMRLTRGPDGTYSYQYVADQDAIAEKTDELNKLKQEMVEIDEKAAKDAADKVYEVYSEMIAKIEELGPDATEEEIYAVMQQYSTRINSLSGIAADALGNLRLSAQSVADAFGIEGSLEEIIPWTNTGWIDTVTSFASSGFENMFSSTWDTIKASLASYRKEMYREDGESGIYAELTAATEEYLTNLGDESTGLIAAQNAQIVNMLRLNTVMDDLSAAIAQVISIVDPNYAPPSIDQYDTGGYTGEWDSSGRLAVLHQKELVLNATDTQKILDAVSLVRSFENSINSALSDRYMEQLALMSARLDLNNLDTQETNIEQTVHITAEFPNVSVKEEIEAAFEDIIDLAAQYAMENKK